MNDKTKHSVMGVIMKLHCDVHGTGKTLSVVDRNTLQDWLSNRITNEEWDANNGHKSYIQSVFDLYVKHLASTVLLELQEKYGSRDPGVL